MLARFVCADRADTKQPDLLPTHATNAMALSRASNDPTTTLYIYRRCHNAELEEVVSVFWTQGGPVDVGDKPRRSPIMDGDVHRFGAIEARPFVDLQRHDRQLSWR